MHYNNVFVLLIIVFACVLVSIMIWIGGRGFLLYMFLYSLAKALINNLTFIFFSKHLDVYSS